MESRIQPEGAYQARSLPRSAFVGRQREMQELKAALEEALSGQGRLVMLTGEPGIGKTRTAQELTAHAEAKGARVLWGRCHEYQGAPPYWPWIQAIRSYVRERDPEQLVTELGPGAAYISQLLPDVPGPLSQVPPSSVMEGPEQTRFRLFDSLTTFLKNASRHQPLVMVLDNLHWADKSSLLLLEFLAQELGESRLLVVGTYRDVDLSRQHPLFETLGELSREGRFQRVLLRGLGQEDVGQFIEAATGIPPSSGLAEAIHVHTEGNPFFMAEVIRLLSDSGGLAGAETGRIGIPEGVREVIGRRLNRLSQQCNETLTAASVVGREFGLEQLNRLMEGLSEYRVLETLEEALAARIIEEMPRVMGRYQFTHALIQQTLLEELSTTRRVRLHARIAEALEALYGANAEEHAVELAYHFAEAEAVTGPEKVVRYSILAGEKALASYAWEEALQHFQRGLAAKGIDPESSGSDRALDEESATIFHSLGLAQVALNLSDQAVSSLRRSFDFYTEASDIAKAVEIAEYSHSMHLIYGMRDVMRRALELVDPDSQEAGRVLANYGFALGESEGGYSSALEMFNRALVISERENDKVLEARTLANAGNVHGFYLRWRECQETTARAIELTSNIDDPRDRLRALLWNSYALTELGEPEQACLRAREGLDLAERFNDRAWFPRCLRALLLPNIAKGDWPEADQICERFQTRASLPYRTYMMYQRGEANRDYAEKDPALQSLIDSAKNIDGRMEALVLGTVAHVTGNPELLHMAESSALGFSQLVRLAGRYRPGWESCVMGCLGLVAASRSDVSAAQSVYSILMTEPGHWSYLCSSDRVRGLMAHTMGNPGQAAEHFEDALAFCRKAGYRPELAWSCHDYAETLLVGAGLKPVPTSGNLEKARTLLNEAWAIASELGMKPLMERAQALQEKMAGQPVPAPIYPDGLTQREVEVLRLIAAGRSNREIAEELTISLKTVARHISNIFAKTSAANRTEAAAYAARHKLVSW